MRRMRRHTKSNNLLFLVIYLKFDRTIAPVAVKNQEAIYTSCLIFRMRIEILNLVYSELIINLSIIA
jgi:hypothetical protein